MTDSAPQADQNGDPFGMLRAELLDESLFKLFTAPAYYPELDAPRPSVLMGGRGTGKTTVLRCLSFEGRYRMARSGVSAWPYIGLYHRINSNRVTAFRGSQLSDEMWRKAFGHYVNLLLVSQVLSFLAWYRENLDRDARLPKAACVEVAATLFLDSSSDEDELRAAVRAAFGHFERFLNNVRTDDAPMFSIQGQPLDEICQHLLAIPCLQGRKVTFIIDEFENLLDYQQIIFNTLIKHSGQYYNFIIGVRELGWRQKYTSNGTEALTHPADYLLIDIGEKLSGENFEKFAAEVCELRRQRIEGPRPATIQASLPGLSVAAEAKLLGVEAAAARILERPDIAPEAREELEQLDAFERYMVDFFVRSGSTFKEILEERRVNYLKWSDRIHNYSVAILFELRQGKAGITKYYAGWNVYVKLANGNIRYLLELIAQARALHTGAGYDPAGEISVTDQTKAAQAVGRKLLFDLPGLSAEGGKLTKLVLGLGRIFEIMAKKPVGRAPEVTSFHLHDNAPLNELEPILREAIMHLALSRTVSNKLSGTDLRGYDYALHPIFAPFFEFSYRRKRKIKLSPSQLLGLIAEPTRAAAQILRQSDLSPDEPLPEQLRLFENFYLDPAR
jgi:hypothetical protein